MTTEQLKFQKRRIEELAKRQPKRNWDSLLKRLDARIEQAKAADAQPVK